MILQSTVLSILGIMGNILGIMANILENVDVNNSIVDLLDESLYDLADISIEFDDDERFARNIGVFEEYQPQQSD